jgi:hypothetical protein
MTIKYFAYSFLVTSVLVLSLSANAYAGTIRIEGILEESDKISKTYDFPKHGIFEISNNNKVCPSNQCKLIPNTKVTSTPSGMFLASNGDSMMLTGFYRLQDDITNGHFTHKKQKLVEGIDFMFSCVFDDIQENLKNGTTKYLCSDKSTLFGGAARSFNNTNYPYTFSASFELPSRHFVLNAEERE